MRGPLEAVAFLGLAAAVHAAVIVGVAGQPGAPQSAGQAGQATVTLAAVPALSQMVATWDTVPEAQDDVARKAVELTSDRAPARPRADQELTARPAGALADPKLPASTPAIPERHLVRAVTPVAAIPRMPVMPGAADRNSDPVPAAMMRPPSATDRSEPPGAPPRPDAPAVRPENPPRPPDPAVSARAPVPRPAMRAEGAGGRPDAGTAPEAPTNAPANSAARAEPALAASWGARIRARVDSRKVVPSGNWKSGKAVLRLRVSRDGRLLSAALVRSAGDARLDRAALRAVRRSGRMPGAPEGFEAAEMTFDLPVSFTR